LTLVELLTVVLLGAILISMALLIYITTSRGYIRQDSLVEQMLNLRSAMAFITRDMRMAGNGFSLLKMAQHNQILVYDKTPEGQPNTWFRYDLNKPEFGVQPLWFSGHTDKPDILTIAYLAPEYSTPIGRLAEAYDAGDTKLVFVADSVIEYPSAIGPNEVLAARDQVAVVTEDKAVILETLSNADDLPELTVVPTPAFPTGYLTNSNLPAGSLVFNVRRLYVHSFRIENDNLVMDTLQDTGELLAEGIEDLQVAFSKANVDPSKDFNLVQDLSSYDLSENALKFARVVLVSKSTVRDPYHNTYPRISALDHAPVGSDSYRRRALEAVVTLRNF
jgi:hypothetical protein